METGYGVKAKFRIDTKDVERLRRELAMLRTEARRTAGELKAAWRGIFWNQRMAADFQRLRQTAARFQRDAAGAAQHVRREWNSVFWNGTQASHHRLQMRRLSILRSTGVETARAIQAANAAAGRAGVRGPAQITVGAGGGTGAGAVARGTLIAGAAQAGAGLLVSGIAGATRGLRSAAMEIENATVGTASILRALDKSDPAQAMNDARGIVGNLRQTAARAPGELQDYLEGFQRMLVPLRQAGMSNAEIQQMTAATVAYGFSQRGAEGGRLAPMDVVQALTSGISDRATPMAIQALNMAGITKDEFRGANTAEQAKMLLRGFKTFDASIEMMGRTVEAQESQLKDRLKQLVTTLGGPGWERYRGTLNRVNGALDENEQRYGELSDAIGRTIDGGFGRLTEALAVGATRIADGAADMVAGWDRAAYAQEQFSKQLIGASVDAEDFGRGLSFVLANITNYSSRYFAQLLLSGRSLIGGTALGALTGIGSDIYDAADPQGEYLRQQEAIWGRATGPGLTGEQMAEMLGMPGRSLPGTGGDAKKVAKAIADEGERRGKRTLEVRLSGRLQWGDDRSLARALGPLLDEVAQQAYRFGAESREGYPMLAGG